MSKFKKKPIVIDATQWWPPGPVDGVDYTPNIAGVGEITTLEGVMQVSPGDWIITGVKGEVYPCKPDIFEATYDPVD